ncbi:MAG: M48 family peptidase, partial [Sulfurovum sp.]|nr:M48 family peptidase [Sulfurovum sp.]
ENLIGALLKLVTENKAFPKSHPLVIFFYHTHPPIIERLNAMGYDASNTIVSEEAEKSENLLSNDDRL